MSFEAAFFGPGNVLEWQKIVDQTLPASALSKLTPFIESLRQPSESAILPRSFQDGSVAWYILPLSARVARFSRDEIRSFLGHSYSLSDGMHTRLDPVDPIDKAVLDKFGKAAFKIYVPPSLRDVARERLLTYLSLRRSRPSRLRTYARSSSRVLRDFEYSILAGSYDGAAERIEELRTAGHLDATNLLFLRVRALACGHRWAEIFSLPEMDSLLNLQRPIRVTECLIRAVYITQLQVFEDQFSPANARTRFSHLYEQYQDLYKTRSKLKGDEIDASFLLAALVAKPVRSDVANSIIATSDQQTPHGQYLSALGQFLPSPVAKTLDPFIEAKEAFVGGDIDKAIQQALLSPSSIEKTVLLLRCAWEAGTLATIGLALESLRTLAESDRTRLRSTAPTAKLILSLESLSSKVETEGDVETDVLSGWLPWLQRLQQPEIWDRARMVAEAGSREWDPNDLAGNPANIAALTDALLKDKPDWSQGIFRDCLPYLVDFFAPSGGDNRFRAIYETLFLLVAMDEQMSASQTQVLTRLGDARLSLGLTQATYIEVVAQLKDTLQLMNSPAVIDSFLDVCESLISHPCLSSDSRIEFFVSTSSALAKWHRRLAPSQRALFGILCDELGHNLTIGELPATDETDNSESFTAALVNSRLGIYSLQERAAKRAALLLRQLVPGLRVEVFSDHVGGSAALKNAAQQFDFFVVVTAAAKHAATIFIESKRPTDKPTLYANGQGSSSIFQALNAHFEGGIA